MFQFFYQTNDAQAIHDVRQKFHRLEQVTNVNSKDRLTITCEDFSDSCNNEPVPGGSIDGYLESGKIALCPPFFTHPPNGKWPSLIYQDAMILRLALSAKGELSCPFIKRDATKNGLEIILISQHNDKIARKIRDHDAYGLESLNG